MTRQEQIRFVALHTLGNFLLLFSLYGVFATFGPVVSEYTKVALIQMRGVTFEVSAHETQSDDLDSRPLGNDEGKKELSFSEILAGDKEKVLTVPDENFSIVIPKLGASSKVIPNIDPNNSSEFLPALLHGVAHAKGSVFPGYSGTTYLFAHSADNWWDAGRYNAIFYTLNNLSENDDIIVYFENKRFNYKVTKKLISDPEDTTYLTAPHTGPNQLVLQTCWPPGTAFKRLYIVAEPKGI